MENDYTIRTALSRKLTELRKEAKLTIGQLSEQSGIHHVAIERYESGEGCPSLVSLLRLAYFFGVSLDELCCMDEYIARRDQDE